MNTIPITFNNRRVSFTVLDSPYKKKEPTLLSAIVLNRGGRLISRNVFDDLRRMKISEIISVETSNASIDYEEAQSKNPGLRFLLLPQGISPGEAINIGMEESSGAYVFVLWADMQPDIPLLAPRFLNKLKERDLLCVAPRMCTADGEEVPNLVVPCFSGKRFLRIQALPGAENDRESLFPFDYAGIYSRDRFILTGGYDYTIANPWWQKADFGFRAYLWGERIKLDHEVKIKYTDDICMEDTTADSGYLRFHLKNLMLRYSGDSGVLPNAGFPRWLLGSGLPPLSAWREFKGARDWVKLNRYRFLTDARGLVDLWEGALK
jgi:hypothetical protein